MTPGGADVERERPARQAYLRRIALAVAAVSALVLFLFAVRLLGAATEAAAPAFRSEFKTLVVGEAGALGASWLATYVLTNGSVVAALSISLLVAEVVTESQVFLLIAGSRLGGAAIVLLIGGLEYVRQRRFSVRHATGLGVLTFIVTVSIYVPATVLGYLSLPVVRPELAGFSRSAGFEGRPLALFEGLTDAVLGVTGPLLGFILSLGLLLACTDLFDRLLSRVETDAVREQFFGRLRQRWVSFGIGLLVTGLTTSVAFSLGVIVPLYNRDYVTRREIVPYILGANIGTFSDTFVVAVVLGSEPSIAAVLTLVGAAFAVTLVVLAAFESYRGGIAAVQDGLEADRRRFTAFLAALVALPLALVVLGTVLP
ncbi:MAG: sodium:phosphate symporter [Haloarculaceae archaeon]